MAKPSKVQPRQLTRSGHVGRGRAYPPLSDKGARRIAFHLSAILWTLHAHGFGGQRRAAGSEVEISGSAEGPLPANAGIFANHALGARRSGIGGRHRKFTDSS